MNEGTFATYTFDVTAIVTFKILTEKGEDAARQAVNAVESISVKATREELDLDADTQPGISFDVSTVAPRGRGYLVDAVDDNGAERSISGFEDFRAPVPMPDLEELAGIITSRPGRRVSSHNDSRELAAYIITKLREI